MKTKIVSYFFLSNLHKNGSNWDFSVLPENFLVTKRKEISFYNFYFFYIDLLEIFFKLLMTKFFFVCCYSPKIFTDQMFF